jgi:parallel beta-helix repeat protein
MAAAALALAPVASAAIIEVTPGANAINKALAKAHNGDTLRIHDGTYREAIDVNKRVTLRGVGGRPKIDARCNHHAPVTVHSGGVTLDHLMAVGAAEGFGSFPSEVDVEGVGGGTFHDLVVNDTCGGTDVGAEYGINVFGSGPVEVSDSKATGGFSDAGIYIGGITDTNGSTLRVVRNGTYLNHQGVIIENSGPPARILVANNRIHHNIIGGEEVEQATGLFIHNSDRVAIRNNVIKNNGHFGVNIDSPSDHNRLIENVITDNPIDLNNDGSANCGSRNTIGSRRGNPLVPCT